MAVLVSVDEKLLPTWALRHPGDRLEVINSCNSDQAVVFWP